MMNTNQKIDPSISHNDKKFFSTPKEKAFTIFLGLLMLFQLLTYIFLLKDTSIDNDDMCQLTVSIASPLSRIMTLLLETDNNPPLFTLLAALWVRMVPYGSAWLKLLSQIFLVLATGLLGRIGYRYGSFMAGIITAVFGATSTLLVYCCADAFRPYGLLFLVGTISLHAYLYRREHQENVTSLIYYGISVFLLAFTHYFGILTCLALFFYDVLLFFCKKNSFKTSMKILLSYIGAGICYIPWGIRVMQVTLAKAGSFWPQIPEWKNIYTNCYSKYFDTSINVLVMLVFLGYLAAYLCKNHLYQVHQKATHQNNKADAPKHKDTPHYLWGTFTYEALGVCLFVPFVVTMIDFLYSKYLNPAGSMWVERYFIVVYPYSFLLIGISWSYVYHLVTRTMKSKLPQLFLISQALGLLLLTGFLVLQGVQFVQTSQYIGSRIEQPFQQACEYLVQQDDFFDDTTGFLPTFTHQKVSYHYFFSKHDQIDVPSFHWIAHPLENDHVLDDYNTVYLLEISTELDEHTSALLQKDFTCVDAQGDIALTKWVRK